MADLRAALQTQLRNIETKTGKTIAHGYGDANTIVTLIGKLDPVPQAGDPLDAKAALRPLHDAVMQVVAGLGAYEDAPKKTYLSLRRKKQFAMVGPATKDAIEIGLNAKDLPPHARLKVQPPASMCQATTRITSAAEIDATLKGWLKQAYDAAG